MAVSHPLRPHNDGKPSPVTISSFDPFTPADLSCSVNKPPSSASGSPLPNTNLNIHHHHLSPSPSASKAKSLRPLMQRYSFGSSYILASQSGSITYPSSQQTRAPHQQPAFCYHPRLFGHPHDIVAPEYPDPFTYQYPFWAPPLYNSFYYIRPAQGSTKEFNPTAGIFCPLYLTAMDHRSTIVGSGSKSASVRKNNHAQQLAGGARRPAPEMVDVYLRKKTMSYNGEIIDHPDEFVRKVPLKTLVRFSGTAQAAFPRPLQISAAQKKDEESKETVENGKFPQHSSRKNSGKVDVNELTSQLAKFSSSSDAANATPTKVLRLGLMTTRGEDAVYLDPTVKAIENCLLWMNSNRHKCNNEALNPFHVPNPDDLPLIAFVEMYAAQLAFALRPQSACIGLLSTIMHRLTQYRPELADIDYIWLHMPIESPVITRMVTAYWEHREKGSYSEQELNAIDDCLGMAEGLAMRFYECGENRAKYRRERQSKNSHATAGAKFQSDWAALAGGKGASPGQGTVGGRENSIGGQGKGKGGQQQTKSKDAFNPNKKVITKECESKVEDAEAEKPEVKDGNGNGNGVGGRHVPGCLVPKPKP